MCDFFPGLVPQIEEKASLTSCYNKTTISLVTFPVTGLVVDMQSLYVPSLLQ